MTDLQKIETNKIMNWIRELIINELDHKTSFEYIRKVSEGYYMQRRCSKNNICDGIWYSHIDIYSKIVTVTATGECSHYFSKEKSKNFIQFVFFFFLKNFLLIFNFYFKSLISGISCGQSAL